MDKKKEIVDLLCAQGLMPLYYHEDQKLCIDIMDALYKGGVRLVEFTNRGEAALQNFAAMKKVAIANYPGLFLGAGTIKTAQDAKAFIDAGADYLISPGLVREVHDIAESNNVLWFPGCTTVTEILTAESWGIRFVKLFPGNILGPSFMSSIKDLFPKIKFMPTGGVDTTKENIAEWFDAGVSAVGMGSKLINKDVFTNKNFEVLTDKTKGILAIVLDCKP